MIDFSKVEGFDWDKGNSRKNDKHGVDMTEAEEIFLDQRLLMFAGERHGGSEARFNALGKTKEGRLLHVTFTVRGGGRKIRVISARPMSYKERGVYEKI